MTLDIKTLLKFEPSFRGQVLQSNIFRETNPPGHASSPGRLHDSICRLGRRDNRNAVEGIEVEQIAVARHDQSACAASAQAST